MFAISPDATRRVRPAALLLALGVGLAGCGTADEPAPAAPLEAAGTTDGEARRTTPYTSAAALLEHLRQVATADDAMDLLDLVYTRSMAERILVERLVARETARRDLNDALRETFPGAAPPDDDLGMSWLAARLAGAAIDRTEGRHAYARYEDPEGAEHQLVLVRYRETWWLAPETLSGGPAIDDHWFIARQRYLIRAPAIYARIAGEVRSGAYASPADARRAVLDAFDGREVAFGVVGWRRPEE